MVDLWILFFGFGVRWFNCVVALGWVCFWFGGLLMCLGDCVCEVGCLWFYVCDSGLGIGC